MKAAAASLAPQSQYTYNAFISYHQGTDRDLALTLQHALHHFAKPLFRARAVRLFLDRTNLAAQPQLWPAIEEGLRQSDYFLLLACPESAASEWVRREIEWWLEHRSAARMLVVQTGGEVRWDHAAADFDWTRTTALPNILAHALPGEPYCLDLRIARPAATADPRFLDAVASLAATLQGRSKDELFGEDVREHRRTLRLARTAVAVLLALTLLAALAAVFAVRRGNQAIEQRGQANLRSIEAQEARELAELANSLAERRQWLAEQRRQEAERQQRIALGRQLAAQAELTRNRRLDLLPRSAALAVESLSRIDSAEARQTLSLALPLLPRPAGAARFAGEFTGEFTEFALSPGAVYFAAAGRQSLGIWEVASGRSVATIPHRYKVRAVAVSRDGRLAALATADRKARIWNVATGREVSALAHSNAVDALAFSWDSRLIATASADRTARIWIPESGLPVTTLKHAVYVSAVAFTPDGNQVATGAYDGLRLWQIEGPREIAFGKVDEVIDSVAVTAGRAYVVGGTRRGGVAVWDTTYRQVRVFRQQDQVSSVAISNDGRYVAVAALDGTGQVWDRASHVETVRAVHRRGVTAAGFDAEGTQVVTAGRDGMLRRWTGLDGGAPARSIPRYHPSSLAYSADGRLVASGESGIAELREPLSGRLLVRSSRTAPNQGHMIRAITVDPGGKLWATGDQEGLVILREVGADREWARFAHAKQQAVIAVAFGPAGRLLATSGYDRTTRIWDLAAKKERAQVAFGAEAVAFSPDGRYLAAGGQDRTARLWDTELKRELARVLHDGYVLAVTFSPDGRWLATGSADRTVRLWSSPHGNRLAQLPHDSEVVALAFSPDGRLLATGSQDGTARLWDVNARQEVLRLPQSAEVRAVAFTRDGRYLLTADTGGLTAAWYLRSADLVRETCLRLRGVLPGPMPPGCPAAR